MTSKNKNLSQRKRTARHKDAHPNDEAERAEKHRYNVRVCLFHIKRNQRPPYVPMPSTIDGQSDVFKKAMRLSRKPIEDHWIK
jgi:hypothetical protein